MAHLFFYIERISIYITCKREIEGGLDFKNDDGCNDYDG